MTRRRTLPVLVFALAAALVGAAYGADAGAPRSRNIDASKAKTLEAEKLRLLAKLHAEAPKVIESPSTHNALEAPIFHRYDRP